MIWIWIIAAVGISALLCKGSGFRYHHYIWLLLPIEMYGISIAGAMLKPYMIYGLVLIVTEVMRQRRLRLPISFVFVTLVLLLSDCANGLHRDSLMQHLMYIFVMLIAVFYVQASNCCLDIALISKTTRSLVLGYGCVFVVSYLVYLINPEFPDLIAMSRTGTGLFLQQYGAGGSISVRFRGFTVDPNSAITPMFPGYCFALYELLTRRKEKARNWLTVIVYWVVVFISGSRAALLCSLALFVIIMFRGFSVAYDQKKWIITMVGAVFLLCVIATTNSGFFSMIENSFIDYLSQRAGLTDEAGRLTIWTKNIQALFESDSWLFGVGQNRIQYYTLEGKHCHNTWVEWICGTGIFIGSGIVMWHLLSPYICYVNMKSRFRSNRFVQLVLSFYSVFVCVIFIDNITNATMAFLLYLLTMCKCITDDECSLRHT